MRLMSSPPQSSALSRIIFGPFAYDESSGELHKHGIRVRLQGQPLHILSAMLRRSGQVISRDEFQQELWPRSTFVDFDHGMNAAMNLLRQALGDSAEQPRYIETLPGRGYRFIAPTQVASPPPVLVMAPLVPREDPKEASPAKRPSNRKTGGFFRLAQRCARLSTVRKSFTARVGGSAGSNRKQDWSGRRQFETCAIVAGWEEDCHFNLRCGTRRQPYLDHRRRNRNGTPSRPGSGPG